MDQSKPKGKRMKDYGVYPINPFRIDSKFIHWKKKDGKDDYVIGDAVFIEKGGGSWVSMDLQPHTKLYSDMYDHLREMSRSGLDVFVYVLRNLTKHGDEILLNIPQIMDGMKISRPSVYLGIIELMDRNMIARKIGSETYFINPDMFFHGDRGKWFSRASKIDKEGVRPDVQRIYPPKMQPITFESQNLDNGTDSISKSS
jgi:hypothetical protein